MGFARQSVNPAAVNETGDSTQFNGVVIVQLHTWNIDGGRDLDQERLHTRVVPRRGVGASAHGGRWIRPGGLHTTLQA